MLSSKSYVTKNRTGKHLEERSLLRAILSGQTQADSFEIDIKRHEYFSDLLLTETEMLMRIVNRVQFLQLQETMPHSPFITVLDSKPS